MIQQEQVIQYENEYSIFLPTTAFLLKRGSEDQIPFSGVLTRVGIIPLRDGAKLKQKDFFFETSARLPGGLKKEVELSSDWPFDLEKKKMKLRVRGLLVSSHWQESSGVSLMTIRHVRHDFAVGGSVAASLRSL